MRVYVFVYLICTISSSFAQQGNQWMLGWIGGVDFNSGIFQYVLYPDTINLRQTSCGISDSTGQIRFWSNGSEIFRSDRSIMGSVPHLPFSNSFVQTGNGLNIYQGAIVIPDPGNNGQYYMFYASQAYVANAFEPINLNTHVYYSKIDMNANGGLGAIISNGIHVEDSLYLGNMIAIKHANGRDWWLLAHKIKSDQYVSWLISPYGISATNYQSIGFNIWNYEYVGSLASSLQGDKIASMLWDGGALDFKRLEVFDFDRCNGQLSNLMFATYQDSGVFLPRAQFSPNGRFVYSTSSWMLYQFDTQDSSFQNSKVLIDVYDGTYAPFEADFQLMELAPDGKIYCHSRNGNYSLHVINDPDSLGLACNFVQNQFNTGVWYACFAGLPNMPNYELGSLQGSICDSLTNISELAFNRFTLNIYPNPANKQAYIDYNFNGSGKGIIEMFNSIGQLCFREYLIKTNDKITIPVENFNSGIYTCKISFNNLQKYCKLIISD